jgi:uncharacterized membrane protein YeiH
MTAMRPGPEWFILLEAIGLISFAINAMIVTRPKGLSTLGVFVAAAATALGGGTLRDIFLGPQALPFFWIAFPFYIVSIFVLAVIYDTSEVLRNLIAKRDFLIKEGTEALAFASLGTVGAAKTFTILAPGMGGGAWAFAHILILCAFLGAMTVTFGGIIRDVLLSEFPATLKIGNGSLETVFIGAGLVGLLLLLGVEQPIALLAGSLSSPSPSACGRSLRRVRAKEESDENQDVLRQALRDAAFR